MVLRTVPTRKGPVNVCIRVALHLLEGELTSSLEASMHHAVNSTRGKTENPCKIDYHKPAHQVQGTLCCSNLHFSPVVTTMEVYSIRTTYLGPRADEAYSHVDEHQGSCYHTLPSAPPLPC